MTGVRVGLARLSLRGMCNVWNKSILIFLIREISDYVSLQSSGIGCWGVSTIKGNKEGCFKGEPGQNDKITKVNVSFCGTACFDKLRVRKANRAC